MRKILSITAATLVLSVGGLAVAATNPFAGAGAATSPSTTTAPKSTDTKARPAVGILKSVLDDLVAKGTLTQAQADAVAGGVKAKVAEVRKANPKAGHRGTRRHKVARAGVAEAAKVIGVPQADLVKALKEGKSIADVATAEGVSPQKVIDALTAKGNARIDAAVKAGKIDADKATKAKARLATMVTRVVNAKHQPR